ncbi:MAG: flagellar motor stator protein MotA [Clostridiales bacterium]|jgi:chemotaxis protein MotA|nr:flagellar motor stator protein MotA [Clostridiales bacterium]
MEITTILGILAGIVSVVGAMIFKHISFSVLYNPAAYFVIFVGTIATILNSYPGKDLKNLGKLFKILFTSNSTKGKEIKIIDEIVGMAEFSRKEGILALEKKMVDSHNDFLKKGLRMIIDACDSEYVKDVLFSYVSSMKKRHEANAGIFTSAGTYAPTLGVLGAVFGLIAAMGNIDDTAEMSHAIAAAFIATILGIFTGYVLWHPFAKKLKIKSQREVLEKMLIIEGVLSIQKGDSPVRIKEKLYSMLPDSEQPKEAEET